MTAFALEGLVQEAINEGVFTVLPKPFDIQHVVGALTSALKAPVVLVVDGQDAAESTVEALRASGVRAADGSDPERALEEVRAGHVDVCVIDLEVAGVGGADLIESHPAHGSEDRAHRSRRSRRAGHDASGGIERGFRLPAQARGPREARGDHRTRARPARREMTAMAAHPPARADGTRSASSRSSSSCGCVHRPP